MFIFVHLLIVLLAAYVVLVMACIVFEPSRKRRVLGTLRDKRGWMYGQDVSIKGKVRFVYITLSALEDEGLVERQTEERPKGADRFFLPRSCYRLTDNGRAASKNLSRVIY